jgi:hypothetical protein
MTLAGAIAKKLSRAMGNLIFLPSSRKIKNI